MRYGPIYMKKAIIMVIVGLVLIFIIILFNFYPILSSRQQSFLFLIGFVGIILTCCGAYWITVNYVKEKKTSSTQFVRPPNFPTNMSKDYKTCPNCGTNNNGNFCIECGEKIV